jgi:hypothetical protein
MSLSNFGASLLARILEMSFAKECMRLMGLKSVIFSAFVIFWELVPPEFDSESEDPINSYYRTDEDL